MYLLLVLVLVLVLVLLLRRSGGGAIFYFYFYFLIGASTPGVVPTDTTESFTSLMTGSTARTHLPTDWSLGIYHNLAEAKKAPRSLANARIRWRERCMSA